MKGMAVKKKKKKKQKEGKKGGKKKKMRKGGEDKTDVYSGSRKGRETEKSLQEIGVSLKTRPRSREGKN